MATIKTESLTKRFGDDVVGVEELDLSVEEGEVYGFLGPNGAGKSTTINLLLNFLQPTDGTARVFGHDTQTDSLQIRQRTGILPEQASLYEELTGREHLEFAMESRGVSEDTDAILDRVGLDREDGDRRIRGYSTGMRQRLSLGMSLIGDPDLLVLDEPSAGLDPTGMQSIRDLIREETDDGTTVFFSSHILPEVQAVCDRVGILNDGRLVAQGTIDELRDEIIGESEIRLDVERPPDDDFGLDEFDGVLEVDVEGRTVTVVCDDPKRKADVVEHVNQQATITEIISEETSLQRMFEAYVSDGGSTTGADDEPTPAREGVSS